MYKTNNINETEMIYSILREKHPDYQINISYDYNVQKYILELTDEKYKQDPIVPVNVRVNTI